VYKFGEAMNLTPEQFQQTDKFEARDLVWNYVSEFKGKTPREAKVTIAALKSFYRSNYGVQLPFDSRRGGKHYIRATKKKAKYEIVPEKNQVYAIVDATRSLRDRALILTLFESGVRVNAACSLNVGDVREQLFPEPTVPLILKITDDIDSKLKGALIPFYLTGLQGEAVGALRNYVKKRHSQSPDDTPLFITRRKTRLSPKQVWTLVKEAVRRAGLDEKGIWVHSLRKAFRKVVRRTNIDDEHKEQLMGHALEGSREAYFDRHATEEIMEAYMKCDFTREVLQNNHARMRTEIEQLQAQNLSFAGMVEELRRELATVKTELKALKKP